MGQKARNGGTIGRARLGYLNHIDGRDIRTIIIDPERGPQVRLRFESFTAGDLTPIRWTSPSTSTTSAGHSYELAAPRRPHHRAHQTSRTRHPEPRHPRTTAGPNRSACRGGQRGRKVGGFT